MVWALGTINLKPGVLRLFEWTKDFNMNKQRNTHAQVWIHLMEFPQDCTGEKTSTAKEQTWIPTTENPSSIGSSLALACPQQDVTPAMSAKVPPPPEPTAEVSPPPIPTAHVPPPPAPHHTAMVVPSMSSFNKTLHSRQRTSNKRP
ncbi:hypothetical protein MTR_0597s0030 [Medicago truncatula]|uniref:DUF4283 domain protein n=1 Tax=Medicago truncatula TaxID=3880 RepID=A0A072TED0_MEDTR|nr:hypothetical protein MTR_0597s0030 [Medicago truncatula]